ncbi:MAG TPA: cytochrome c biogenesis protein DipZ [Gaiellaceae bacterium]|nr:cytochrome c biogenesis protein DipZ [Gaiellaceae bacterium]
MIVLLGIGLLAGFVTAISPCVLPVLPILLAGGATGRKPLRIITGLVASFVVFTLSATWLLGKLGLRDDRLRQLAIVMLFLLAATLLIPQLGRALERPFTRLTRYRAGGGGFLLGASLGLVFTPCAGPVLATISSVAAQEHVGWRAILLTVAYAVGAGVPMLLIAYGGREVSTQLRAHDAELRLASGALIGLVAVALTFNLDTRLATHVPGYVSSIQNSIEGSSSASKQLAKVSGVTPLVPKKAAAGTGSLPDYGPAPEITGTEDWFNSKPLKLSQLRGKVVLIDFWTYSCINCLRTLPHLKAWYDTYHSKGLEIIGIHTPEFAFEHVASNVKAAVKRLGIPYPVAQDNNYATWDAYSNQYWPAEYLIDKNGRIRHTDFGEGDYSNTEALIRQLLGAKGKTAPSVPDLTPTDLTTPESYLGYERLARYGGSLPLTQNHFATYSFPKTLDQNELAYSGSWNVQSQRIVAGKDAKLRLNFTGEHVYLVLGGHGTVQKLIDGKPAGSVDVNAYKLYTLHSSAVPEQGLLELRFTPGVQAYAFTFG